MTHAMADEPVRDAKIERCIACEEPLKSGDLVLPDYSGGVIHSACCGPERESYVDPSTGTPLSPGEPLPKPYRWQP